MRRNLVPYSAFVALTAVWLGWTVLVDFFVIRTVFSTVSNFFEAGDLGIAVFSKLNNLELVASSAILALMVFQTMKNRQSVKLLVLGLAAWIIIMVYFFWLTPKLVHLTELWKAAEAASTIGVSGIADIQQEHQYYHRLYIGLDTVKLVVLSTLLGLGIWKNEEWT